MMSNKEDPVFREKCKSESTAADLNLQDFWNNCGQGTVEMFSNFTTAWPVDDVGKEDEFLLQSYLEKSQVLIFTANQVEANTVVRLLSSEAKKTESESNWKQLLGTITTESCVFHFGTIDGVGVAHVQPLTMASFTMNGSFQTAQNIFKRYKPKIAVSLGVAFGQDASKQRLGDVLVSKAILPYDVNTKWTSKNLKFKGNEIYPTHSRLICGWRNVLSYQNPPDNFNFLSNKPFHWYFGTILSGGFVVDDVDLKINLLEAAEAVGVTDVIGGEMEGNGIYLACKEENIPCVVIKGICDWGVSKNTWDQILNGNKITNDTTITNDTVKDSIQAMATANAFATLKYLLSFDRQLVQTHEAPIDWKKKEAMGRLRNALDRFAMRIAVLRMLPYMLILLFCIPCVSIAPAFSLWVLETDNGYSIPIILSCFPLIALLLKLRKRLRVKTKYSLKKNMEQILDCAAFVALNILLLLLFCRTKERMWLFYITYLFLIGLFVIMWLYAKYLRGKPEPMHRNAAVLRLTELNFEGCCCIIEHTGKTKLYQVTIGWYSKTQLTPVQLYDFGEWDPKDALRAQYQKVKAVSLTNKQPYKRKDNEAVPVVPDLLQISYRMPDGHAVVHMITKAPKRTNTNRHIDTSGFCFSYTEEVFQLHKEKYKTLYKRVCLIHKPD